MTKSTHTHAHEFSHQHTCLCMLICTHAWYTTKHRAHTPYILPEANIREANIGRDMCMCACMVHIQTRTNTHPTYCCVFFKQSTHICVQLFAQASGTDILLRAKARTWAGASCGMFPCHCDDSNRTSFVRWYAHTDTTLQGRNSHSENWHSVWA